MGNPVRIAVIFLMDVLARIQGWLGLSMGLNWWGWLRIVLQGTIVGFKIVDDRFVLCGWLPFCKSFFAHGISSEAVLCSAC
jgi:hypothetical protein